MTPYNTAGYTKEEWQAKLETMTDAELRNACNQYIWLSAYASNNGRSAYHWMSDATHAECDRRGVTIYAEEHAKLVAEAQG